MQFNEAEEHFNFAVLFKAVIMGAVAKNVLRLPCSFFLFGRVNVLVD